MHNELSPENRYFFLLYNKAYNRLQYWQDQMHKQPDGSPEWQLAAGLRSHYADLCVWLDANSPSNTKYGMFEKRG